MSGDEDRLLAPERSPEDGAESSIRPLTLDEFVGQKKVRENLRVFVQAARGREEALDRKSVV